MFYLYQAWPALRPLALELGQRLTDVGTLPDRDHVFYLFFDELKQASAARRDNKAVAELNQLAAERFELREARRRLHPPGTVPFDASEDPGVKFKETQFVNDPDSDTMMGVPVSPGTITAPVSLINSPAEFDQMRPGSILVCPMTNPAWTPLFAHASGLVTEHGRHSGPWLHRRPRVRNPGGGGYRHQHTAHQSPPNDHRGRRRRHREAAGRRVGARQRRDGLVPSRAPYLHFSGNCQAG